MALLAQPGSRPRGRPASRFGLGLHLPGVSGSRRVPGSLGLCVLWLRAPGSPEVTASCPQVLAPASAEDQGLPWAGVKAAGGCAGPAGASAQGQGRWLLRAGTSAVTVPCPRRGASCPCQPDSAFGDQLGGGGGWTGPGAAHTRPWAGRGARLGSGRARCPGSEVGGSAALQAPSLGTAPPRGQPLPVKSAPYIRLGLQALPLGQSRLQDTDSPCQHSTARYCRGSRVASPAGPHRAGAGRPWRGLCVVRWPRGGGQQLRVLSTRGPPVPTAT